MTFCGSHPQGLLIPEPRQQGKMPGDKTIGEVMMLSNPSSMRLALGSTSPVLCLLTLSPLLLMRYNASVISSVASGIVHTSSVSHQMLGKTKVGGATFRVELRLQEAYGKW